MHNSSTFILASKSPYRADILKQSGIEVIQHPSNLDERELETSLAPTIKPAERAQFLASAKAKKVSLEHPDSLVLGCDQILVLSDEILHKVSNRREAFERLTLLSGKTHYLYSALALSRGGELCWEHTERCVMIMRTLTSKDIEDYLTRGGEDILKSVGVYQIEGIGSELFESYQGDLSSIIGLPLVPLLAALRSEGILND